ncbi:hypothetical protein ACHQM5_020242 [Ranunculus cassubicifolius]
MLQSFYHRGLHGINKEEITMAFNNCATKEAYQGGLTFWTLMDNNYRRMICQCIVQLISYKLARAML